MSIVKVASVMDFGRRLFGNGVAMAESNALKKELEQATIALKKAEEEAAKKGGKMMPLIGGTAIGAGGLYAYNQRTQQTRGYY